MDTNTSGPDTLSIYTPKGSALHLVREGEALTLCGRPHYLNPRYVHAGMAAGRIVQGAPTCAKCKVA